MTRSSARLIQIISAVFLSLSVTAPPREADAAAPKIALIGRANDDPVVRRLRAELTALGFEVVELVEAAAPPAREPLEQAARATGAVAAIRLAQSRAGVEVWIVDRVTGKTVLREVVEEDMSSTSREVTIALRAVELLRASLLEMNASHPSRGDVAPAPEVEALADSRAALPPPPAQSSTDARASRGSSTSVRSGSTSVSSRPLRGASELRSQASTAPTRPPVASLELSGAGLLSPGGIGGVPAFFIGARIRPEALVSGGAFLVVPIIAPRLDGKEGSATVRIAMAGAGLRIAGGKAGSLIRPTVEAGASAVWLHLQGFANPHYIEKSDDVFTFAPYARAGLGIAAAERLRIRADLQGSASMPHFRVRFAGRDVAEWGRPIILASAGLEVALP